MTCLEVSAGRLPNGDQGWVDAGSKQHVWQVLAHLTRAHALWFRPWNLVTDGPGGNSVNRGAEPDRYLPIVMKLEDQPNGQGLTEYFWQKPSVNVKDIDMGTKADQVDGLISQLSKGVEDKSSGDSAAGHPAAPAGSTDASMKTEDLGGASGDYAAGAEQVIPDERVQVSNTKKFKNMSFREKREYVEKSNLWTILDVKGALVFKVEETEEKNVGDSIPQAVSSDSTDFGPIYNVAPLIEVLNKKEKNFREKIFLCGEETVAGRSFSGGQPPLNWGRSRFLPLRTTRRVKGIGKGKKDSDDSVAAFTPPPHWKEVPVPMRCRVIVFEAKGEFIGKILEQIFPGIRGDNDQLPEVLLQQYSVEEADALNYTVLREFDRVHKSVEKHCREDAMFVPKVETCISCNERSPTYSFILCQSCLDDIRATYENWDNPETGKGRWKKGKKGKNKLSGASGDSAAGIGRNAFDPNLFKDRRGANLYIGTNGWIHIRDLVPVIDRNWEKLPWSEKRDADGDSNYATIDKTIMAICALAVASKADSEARRQPHDPGLQFLARIPVSLSGAGGTFEPTDLPTIEELDERDFNLVEDIIAVRATSNFGAEFPIQARLNYSICDADIIRSAPTISYTCSFQNLKRILESGMVKSGRRGNVHLYLCSPDCVESYKAGTNCLGKIRTSSKSDGTELIEVFPANQEHVCVLFFAPREIEQAFGDKLRLMPCMLLALPGDLPLYRNNQWLLAQVQVWKKDREGRVLSKEIFWDRRYVAQQPVSILANRGASGDSAAGTALARQNRQLFEYLSRTSSSPPPPEEVKTVLLNNNCQESTAMLPTYDLTCKVCARIPIKGIFRCLSCLSLYLYVEDKGYVSCPSSNVNSFRDLLGVAISLDDHGVPAVAAVTGSGDSAAARPMSREEAVRTQAAMGYRKLEPVMSAYRNKIRRDLKKGCDLMCVIMEVIHDGGFERGDTIRPTPGGGGNIDVIEAAENGKLPWVPAIPPIVNYRENLEMLALHHRDGDNPDVYERMPDPSLWLPTQDDPLKAALISSYGCCIKFILNSMMPFKEPQFVNMDFDFRGYPDYVEGINEWRIICDHMRVKETAFLQRDGRQNPSTHPTLLDYIDVAFDLFIGTKDEFHRVVDDTRVLTPEAEELIQGRATSAGLRATRERGNAQAKANIRDHPRARTGASGDSTAGTEAGASGDSTAGSAPQPPLQMRGTVRDRAMAADDDVDMTSTAAQTGQSGTYTYFAGGGSSPPNRQGSLWADWRPVGDTPSTTSGSSGSASGAYAAGGPKGYKGVAKGNIQCHTCWEYGHRSADCPRNLGKAKGKGHKGPGKRPYDGYNYPPTSYRRTN